MATTSVYNPTKIQRTVYLDNGTGKLAKIFLPPRSRKTVPPGFTVHGHTPSEIRISTK